MPEPEFANLETKRWLPSRRTALAHFDFRDPKAKNSCINEELYAGVDKVVYSCDYVNQGLCFIMINYCIIYYKQL